MKLIAPSLGLFCLLVLNALLIGSPSATWATEESLNLESDTVVSTPAMPSHSVASQRFYLMGRVDLTSEFSNPGSSPTSNPHGKEYNRLSNNHLLVFLKVKASEKTKLMAEIVNQTFFSVDVQVSPKAEIKFGKIIVPFGDTRRFHHFYGGIQGFGTQGVMLPNIWAEPGMNVAWKLSAGELDTYVVESLSAINETSDPDLRISGSVATQAEGLRWTTPLGQNVTGIVSGYYGEYYHGQNMLMGGLDLYSDYGAWASPLFRDIRWGLGFATAEIKSSPRGNDFQKRGDFIEVATKYIEPGELRLRYGTYIHDSRVTSVKDTHSWSLGYQFELDVVRVLVEQQMNFEAVDEFGNDLFRVMASLDF